MVKNKTGQNFQGAPNPASVLPWRVSHAASVAAGEPACGRAGRGVCVPQVWARHLPKWMKKTRPCNLFLTSHPGLTPELCLAGRHHRGSCDNPGPALPSWSRCVGRKDVAVGTGDLQDKKRMKDNYFGLEVHTHLTVNLSDMAEAIFFPCDLIFNGTKRVHGEVCF